MDEPVSSPFSLTKGWAGLEFESAYGMLESKIADLCKAHFYLADSKKVNDSDKKVFYRLCDEAAKPNQVKSSLLTLIRMMHAHYDKPVIFLLDEYDVPLAKAHDADKAEKDYYPKMLDVARGLMSCVLKTNPFLKFAVITRCLRIAKESIFTGVNHFSTYSILDEKFSDSFGFTQKEVKQVLEKAGLPDRLELVKSWYDGYIFGNTEIFCPWDVARDSDNRRVIIIEAKKANAKKDMEKMCLEGVQQIADKKYYMDPKFDGFKEIICYGISFYKKDALVRLGYSTAHS